MVDSALLMFLQKQFNIKLSLLLLTITTTQYNLFIDLCDFAFTFILLHTFNHRACKMLQEQQKAHSLTSLLPHSFLLPLFDFVIHFFHLQMGRRWIAVLRRTHYHHLSRRKASFGSIAEPATLRLSSRVPTTSFEF